MKPRTFYSHILVIVFTRLCNIHPGQMLPDRCISQPFVQPNKNGKTNTRDHTPGLKYSTGRWGNDEEGGLQRVASPVAEPAHGPSLRGDL